MIKKKQGMRALNIAVPADLHDMLKRLAIEEDLTATSIIIQYLQYLQKKHYSHRKVLNEQSDSDFEITPGKSR